MLTKVKAHTRRGRPVRAHSRRVSGAATQQLADAHERAIEQAQQELNCPHDGRFLARALPSLPIPRTAAFHETSSPRMPRSAEARCWTLYPRPCFPNRPK